MALSTSPWFSFSPGTFALVIAPPGILREALNGVLAGHRGRTLYLCGNYPAILPGLLEKENRFQVRRALTAYQILSILGESDEPLTLFEHDRTLIDENADLLKPVGEACRQRAEEHGSLVLFASRHDTWLSRIEPYAHRVAYFRMPQMPRRTRPARSSPSHQQIVERGE